MKNNKFRAIVKMKVNKLTASLCSLRAYICIPLQKKSLVTFSFIVMHLAMIQICYGSDIDKINKQSFCKIIASMVKDGTYEKYAVKSKEIPNRPQDSQYTNLDLDGDGIEDKVLVSSGSEGSYLEVELSKGINYDLEADGFITIIKIKNKVYALVTNWKWKRTKVDEVKGRIISYHVYELTDHNAKAICNESELRGRMK